MSQKRLVIIVIIMLILLASVNICVSASGRVDDSIQICYGFIIPCYKNENDYIKEQTNYKIKTLVNDFLREEIPVYWTSTNKSMLVSTINDTQEPALMFFEKGAYIITFTGENKQDTKIVSIICDYNETSEIEESNIFKIPVYEIMEPLDIPAYKLSDVKIAQYRNLVTIAESFILTTASKCGFLNIEFLDHTNLAEKLDNNVFNVIVWPGSGPEYSTFYKSAIFKTFYDDIKFKISRAIRDFVNEGGGYIGTCYGAYRAANGMKIGPLYISFSRRVYNPQLNSIGTLAISDVIVNFPKNMVMLPTTYSKINDDTHPITYGLDDIVNDFIWGGPEILRVGKNSQVIASFFDTNNPYNGRPSWVSSKFGKGKVAIFSGHPEILAGENNNRSYDGAAVLSNSLFYTTSKGEIQLDITKARNISFIENIWNFTLNLTDYLQEKKEVFKEIKIKINETILKINNLYDYLIFLQDLIKDIANEKNTDKEKLGYISISEATNFYLHPYVTYLENTTKVLEKIETLYPALSNDTNFLNSIEKIKNDLKFKLNEVEKIITKSYILSKDCEKLLLSYKESNILSNLQSFLILDKSHKFHWNVFLGFYYIPQTYFNSLKLLRSSWYSFETDLAL